ncbi:MAG: LysR family transcriptional regulator [Burkholderiales bacterium]
MDKLQAMATFVRIVERGSLTRAAESLGTSLPSVVRTLAALERELGVRLLNRTTRRIHVTDEGALYVDRCRAVLAAIGDAEAALASRRAEPQGRLAVTAPVLFGRRFVAPVVNAYLARFRAASVDLLLLDRPVGLVEEGLDVGVRIGALADSSLVAVPVGTMRRVVCASPAYLRAHGVPRVPDDVRTHAAVRFAGVTPGSDWRFRVGRRTVAVPVTSRLVCNQVDAAVAACIDGVGLGTFLSYQVAAAVAERRLRYVLEPFEPEPVPVSVIYPHARLPSTNVRAFVDLAVPTLRETRFV